MDKLGNRSIQMTMHRSITRGWTLRRQQRSAELPKFMVRLGGFVAVQAALSLVFVVPYWLKWEEAVGKSYIASTIDKHKRLQQRHSSSRMIFIGGSSAAFGIDSPYIQQKLGYTPVNMGINAGVGAEVYVE